ncbi:MAG: ATP-binding protein [Rhodocyclaceae bacterium]
MPEDAETPETGGGQQLTAAFARLSQTYESILHATSEGIFGFDSAGRISYANAAAARMLGWQVEDMLGQTLCDVVHDSAASAMAVGEDVSSRSPLWPAPSGGQSRRRSEFRARSGALLAVEYSVALIVEDDRDAGAVLVFSDVSERDRTERALQESMAALRETNERLSATRDQLLQSEKMAAIGQLAAGVAHEINTPIGYVSSNIGSLQGYFNDLLTLLAVYEQVASDLAADSLSRIARARQECDLDFLREDSAGLLRETQVGVATVVRIVRELMDFSASGEHGEWQWCDLSPLLDSALADATRRGDNVAAITVVREYAELDELPRIFCLASAIREVFSKLLINALQAVARDGRIVIRCRRDGAERVRVEIVDDGIGIAAENLGRVFNPFYTTRPVGSGSGMGLSVADNIVRRHGGGIEIDSASGRGTKVSVVLPLRRGGTPEAAPGRR